MLLKEEIKLLMNDSFLGRIFYTSLSLAAIEGEKHYAQGLVSTGLGHFCSVIQLMGAHKKEKLLLGYTEF